ncbi:glycine--tRNA ligase [Candidatus Campbellbacteria bacterium CG22_combo_CG10-13_8_21_14_all_36_13]|uniref:Glycine--tRNA ligase n=1 Tax=Candidatus Campbellbacteria bacterium CG22_combo_CG10-13_8_21_14_all_36_13 TaxID=1974529 RepID=A0A2H0DZ46_9BACT|nr:MAG: glycine--tRNA ligase [Candidatus Campbellbacteria bacterium CG22_combo_CG10-13_8_21_14_all_36_13]
MDKLTSLLKRRGFIYQGSEIYGGLGGTWDYGPLGVELKNKLKQSWWKKFVQQRSNIYGIDASILMNKDVWVATGHVDNFSDPLVECSKCKKRFRVDQIEGSICPECEGELGDVRQFNMMFKTQVGSVEDSASTSYLRPETAQGIFVNFKNIIDSFHPEIPFGMAQIGKAFRNEITPRDFLFRAREFEQMEVEYFVTPESWEENFETWRKDIIEWLRSVGLTLDRLHEKEVDGDELAHYSKRTIDFEYDYPFGRKELLGLAYRTDFDLSRHAKMSGVNLEYFDQVNNDHFIPHVIEPSFGVDRLVLALLLDAYHEEDVAGESRVVMRLDKSIVPIQIAILPLMKKDGMSEYAKNIFKKLSNNFVCHYDETASIGKRYRRQDEIGTPYAITVDYDSLEDNTVTVRERDTMVQKRIPVDELQGYFEEQYKFLN